MKYIFSFLGVVIIVFGIFFFNKKEESQDFIRIHITANSDSEIDQNLKYLVKDAVVEYLIPFLSKAENEIQAKEIIISQIQNIEDIVGSALLSQGVNYGCKISLKNEEIPTRVYDSITLEKGLYETLSIELGEAQGDNWWCVVFPAVCFISSKNPENLVYISKIWEIINSVT
ncbi:MAG: hypothetical protein E7375_02310 [Clostridiales bacterium]|nr:hypothetical protein [Clostridiales bacterium]